MEIKLIKNVKQQEKLWREFCKPKVIWDLWEIRKTFLDVYKYEALFVKAIKNDKVVGVLPLWFDKNENRYEWISGWWAENSKPFCNDAKVLKQMLERVNGKISLEAMQLKYAKLFPGKVQRDYDHYELNLDKVENSWEGYLVSIKKKKRQNIRRDIRSVTAMNPVFRYDQIKDLKHLVRLNKIQMKRKVKMYDDECESVFSTDKHQEKSFYKLWQRAGKEYQCRILTVLVKGKVVGCDFNLLYNGTYYSLLGGNNVGKVSGIGTFMNYLDITDAIDHKCKVADFLMEDHHWKKDWFKGTRRYKYVREK